MNYAKGAAGAEKRDPSPRLGGEAGVPADGRDGASFCVCHWARERESTDPQMHTRNKGPQERGAGPRGTWALHAAVEEAAPGPGPGPGRPYPQGRVQVPAGLVQGLLGGVHGVAHPLQVVYVLQAESLLLFFLFPYLGQFL